MRLAEVRTRAGDHHAVAALQRGDGVGVVRLGEEQEQGIGRHRADLAVVGDIYTEDAHVEFEGVGKAIGRRKLAPSISPGKSWEGAIGGLIGVIVLGFVWVHVIDVRVPVDSASMYSVLVHRTGWVSLLALAFLSAMSVVGDLFESLVKRAAGAKDSSQLLPGHGGVLDRVDALLPVLPLALALTSV